MTSHGPATKKRALSLVLAVIVALGVMFVLPVRAMAASSDASLLKVAGYTITPGSETGADAANAITAAITVPNATVSIADTDLEPTDANATVSLYDDAGFSNAATVTLMDGTNELYIKVTAEDTVTIRYYHVTVTRVDNTVPVITTTTLPDGMAGVPYYANLASSNADSNGRFWTVPASGEFPKGLSCDTLNPIVTGIPTTAGEYTFTVSVRSTPQGESAPVELTIKVVDYNLETVGFGGYEWLVVGDGSSGIAQKADALTLLSRNHVFGDSWFDDANNEYSGSNLQSTMNDKAGLLSANEQGLIVPRTLVGGSDNQGTSGYNDDNIAGAEVTGALYWPLSVNEANGLSSDFYRQYGASWWLRSPGLYNINAAVVDSHGAVDAPGGAVDNNFGVRPAFHLNLQSALFTSAATGGKSGPAGATLVAAQPPANFYKFTMTTTDLTFLSLSANNSPQSAAQGGSVTIPYTGAQTGTNKFVSCIITDAGGNVLYYGKLATGTTSGNAVINIPSNMQTGDYTIKLFNEQINGGNYTDFASTPVEIPLTVELGYTVSGTITGSDAPGGLAASVQLQQNGGNVGSAVAANADGTYTITGVAAGTGYTVTASMGGYTAGTTASFDVSGDVTGQDLVLQKTTGTNPDLFAPTNHSGITYLNRTLTDAPTGVTVAGRMTSGAKLTVRERVLHIEGACSACDEIRERQAAGEVIVLYDIALSGGNMGGLMVSIPVGSQYDGQTLTILHCNNGKLESVSATVTGGMATGMFKSLSPFAVVGEMRVAVPDEVVQDAPKTGDSLNVLGFAMLALCAVAAVNRKLKMEN